MLGDTLRLLVARKVVVARLHFFVLVLVGDRQVRKRAQCDFTDVDDEFVAMFDDTLCTVLVETKFGHDLFDGISNSFATGCDKYNNSIKMVKSQGKTKLRTNAFCKRKNNIRNNCSNYKSPDNVIPEVNTREYASNTS